MATLWTLPQQRAQFAYDSAEITSMANYAGRRNCVQLRHDYREKDSEQDLSQEFQQESFRQKNTRKEK